MNDVRRSLSNTIGFGATSEAMEYAAQRVNQREYLGTVDEVALNDRLAAVRFEGRVSVHVIESAEDPTESLDFQLPEPGQDADISCIQMTNEFLVFGTQRGTIHYFYLPDRVSVNEYRHEDGAIKSLHLNATGTRLVFVDTSSVPAFFNPVNDQVLPIPDFRGPPQAVLWDAADPNCFVTSNGKEFQVYTYAATTINGRDVRRVLFSVLSSCVLFSRRCACIRRYRWRIVATALYTPFVSRKGWVLRLTSSKKKNDPVQRPDD